ncbi:MAG: hypothetical protein ACE15E_21680, partial [Acidobacteriota bacterium]
RDTATQQRFQLIHLYTFAEVQGRALQSPAAGLSRARPRRAGSNSLDFFTPSQSCLSFPLQAGVRSKHYGERGEWDSKA